MNLTHSIGYLFFVVEKGILAALKSKLFCIIFVIDARYVFIFFKKKDAKYVNFFFQKRKK
jgi:hypothetical protein